MSRIFKCSKCGCYNLVGQKNCAHCNEKFEYRCIQCGVIIDITYTSCPNCNTQLSWPQQVYEKLHNTPSEAKENEKSSLNELPQSKPVKKKKRISRTLIFSIPVLILIIVGFYILPLLIEPAENVYVDYYNRNAGWKETIHNDILINESALSILNNQLNTWVTWADGTNEKVQIDENNYIIVDDEKRRLVGIVMDVYTPIEPNYNYWLPEQYDFLNKELLYLESIDMRLVRLVIPYNLWSHENKEEQMYYINELLKLLYNHKMLVIASIHPKYFPGFNNLEVINFDILKPDLETPIGDTNGDWIERTASLLDEYENVIAVCIDNELDFMLLPGMHWSSPDGHDYTVERVEQHLLFMKDIVRSETNLPVTHNLCSGFNKTNDNTAIKLACIDMIDIPSFDVYTNSYESIIDRINRTFSILDITGTWWCTELSYSDQHTEKWKSEADKFKIEQIEAVFDSGATIAILYKSNESYPSRQAFFDRNGNPKSSLLQIAEEMERLQSTIE